MYHTAAVCDECGGHGRSAIDSEDGWDNVKVADTIGVFSMRATSCFVQNYRDTNGNIVERREVHFCSHICAHSYMLNVALTPAADDT